MHGPTHTSCAGGNSPAGRGWRAGLHSLQFKTSLFVVLLIVAMVVAGMALTLRAMSTVVYGGALNRAGEWATSISLGAASAVEARDREALAHIVEELICGDGVAGAAFTDSSGQELASAEKVPGLLAPFRSPDGKRIEVQPLHEPHLRQTTERQLSCVDVVVPVFGSRTVRAEHQSSPVILGYLRMVEDVSGAQEQLGEISRYLLRVGLTVVLLVVPCSLLVTRYVVAPLNELVSTAQAISGGAMDARAKVDSRNEIGALSRSLNTMADRVAQSQAELRRLNAELEQRVAQRTRELEDLASRDPLTGLYNRRHFGEVITHEFAAAERYDSDLTVLMFDVDHFKETNDRFGHRTGDEVLMLLAKTIHKEQRESDVGARFGGDEFILLLPQTSAHAASSLADRIVDRFGSELQERFPGVPATLSIGVASLRTTRAPSSEALIHEADLALYAAKEAGRNRTVSASRHHTVERQSAETAG